MRILISIAVGFGIEVLFLVDVHGARTACSGFCTTPPYSSKERFSREGVSSGAACHSRLCSGR